MLCAQVPTHAIEKPARRGRKQRSSKQFNCAAIATAARVSHDKMNFISRQNAKGTSIRFALLKHKRRTGALELLLKNVVSERSRPREKLVDQESSRHVLLAACVVGYAHVIVEGVAVESGFNAYEFTLGGEGENVGVVIVIVKITMVIVMITLREWYSLLPSVRIAMPATAAAARVKCRIFRRAWPCTC